LEYFIEESSWAAIKGFHFVFHFVFHLVFGKLKTFQNDLLEKGLPKILKNGLSIPLHIFIKKVLHFSKKIRNGCFYKEI
jgi:hypothetical protein